ncbi:MAG: hypothetical protein ACK456_03755 [Pseudanabaenaceae cyanobacterium]|jgi:hypothetical protein
MTQSYYFPLDPPYFLLIASLVAGIICGYTFQVTLRNLVNDWSASQNPDTTLRLKGSNLSVPYLGMTVSVGFFLSSGLEIFGFPTWLSYAGAVPLTLGTSYFVWRQLGKMLIEFVEFGSVAMDLDVPD